MPWQRLQSVFPNLTVDHLLLGLDLAAFAEALLPQGQRAGEGQVDVRVEALRVVHRQAAHFQHPVKDPLQVKQRDIGGLAALLKEDSYCSQKTQEESTMNNVERLKNYQNRNAATIEALYRAVLQDRARRENSHETA